MVEIDSVLLVLAGIVGGFIAGLLGVGGGIIYILVLPVFLVNYGVCEKSMVSFIVANSIFTILTVSFSANIKRIINSSFHYKEVLIIGVSGALSSVLCMNYIVQSFWYSKMFFNVVVVVMILFMLIRLFMKVKGGSKSTGLFKYVVIGTIAGAGSALSGLGGGVVIVPLLIYMFNMDVKEAKTISLGVIGVMALVLSVRNLSVGDICPELVMNQGLIVFPVSVALSLGVLVGTPIGVRVARNMNEKWLKILFGLMLLVVIIKKFYEIATEVQWL